ncbi:huntingtin-interacting protein 1 [Scaptodrosophila lebanonensis]|uniref:Huntingtin-interacting protein 1 n=1 Tax=Drosophila lebanonensis TaxID=7225 RepID=A0A6J2TJR7_DROLE|nr:huntingtin-interacting protein 1 [Scaptodrosophila lebanonensis]
MSTNSEKDFYNLTISVNKALNGIEAPLKTKHARSVIIMIHKAKEAKSFWRVVSRQPLMESRFTAWKFCHLLHKVLREAHPCALQHSQSQKTMILEIGKLWGHLQDDIGYCIKAYTKLLVTKLSFHEKNRMYPGSLLIAFADIEKVAEGDINFHFQLCVEIFDYLDDIIALQLTIFSSINTYRMSSMTQQGQCRLAPLICLIQDSNALYDISVRLMFKLHDVLPKDVLNGHRDRFNDIFVKLKCFYENVRPLQYFADLIKVPLLPECPNFRSHTIQTYVAPVLVVQPEPIVDDLVNTNFDNSSELDGIVVQRVETLENIISDKEEIIEQLKSKLDIFKTKYDELEVNYSRDISELQRNNTALSNELASTNEMCSSMRLAKDELELQLSNTPTLNQKVLEDEEKLKLSAEKFDKLKTMYTQIRDEHINLLRQQSDSSKRLTKEKQTNSELMLEIKSLNHDMSELKGHIDELTENNSNLLKRIDEQSEHFIKFESLQKDLRTNFEETIQKKDEENISLHSTVQQLKAKEIELENHKSQLQTTVEKLTQAEDIIKAKDEEIQKNLAHYEKEAKTRSVTFEENEKMYQNDCHNLRSNLEELQNKLMQSEQSSEELKQRITSLHQEKEETGQKYLDLEKQVHIHKGELNNVIKEANVLKDSNKKCLEDTQELRQLIIKTIEEICASKLQDSTQQPLEVIPKIILETESLLDKTVSSSQASAALSIYKIKDIINLGYTFVKLYDQCDLIYKSTTEIEKGQNIFSQIRSICTQFLRLFQNLQNEKTNQQTDEIVNEIKINLNTLKKLVQELLDTYDNKVDLDKLVQIELKEMDVAIEAAASQIMELLSSARKKHNGIKLEVNEKILDACTTLMECIKVLIVKSRILQQEIISSRKGNATVNEFYKRNSQWSEGLISASKSVAKAANYLVKAANNAVVSESGQNFELIVAAQEIAACTAQLVIASKVKANGESKSLTDLTDASRSVTKATGTVVATVKDCNVQLEQATDVEFCKLTPSQIKTMEMEIHVKVLQLEQALQTQRFKLSAFRREHYQTTEY